MRNARTLSLMVILALFMCSLQFTSVSAPAYSSKVTGQLIQTQGEILYASPPTPQMRLRVNGLYLEDALGNRVRLKGIQVCYNDRMAVQESTSVASDPSQTWFSLADVQRMKVAGATCLELSGNGLSAMMPTKNVPSESYFATWMDKWVSWCTQNQMYCVIQLRGIGAYADWAIELSLPDWLWQGIYSTPTTKAKYDTIIRDFFDTNVTKQDSNRAALVNLWAFIANRYKENPYVLYGIMNEPLNFVDIPSTDVAIHLGQTYSTFMEQIVDGIRNTGSQQIVIIDAPFLWDSNGWYVVHPVNKDNIVWEVHEYVTSSTTLSTWEGYVDNDVGYFAAGFGKPVFMGEYGFDPPTCAKATYRSTWQTLLASQVSYLDGKSGIASRQFHAWDYLYGEYDVFVGSSDFTAAESTWIIQTVLG